MNPKVRQFAPFSSPHQIKGSGVGVVMLKVLVALLPAVLVKFYFYGYSMVWVLGSCLLFCWGFEIVALWLRKRPVRALADASVSVTAVLLALALPTTAPWWLLLMGCGAAVLLGKQVYGGLGYNPFNPAMVGYIVLLIAFPLPMSRWAVAFADLSWQQSALLWLDQIHNLDAMTAATALDYAKTQLKTEPLSAILTGAAYGHLGAVDGEWLALAYMLGGALLLWWQIIPWQTPLAMLLSLAILAAVGHWLDPEQFLSAPLHLFSGATMLAAFFIITDPVSGCASGRGRLIFGALVGVLVYVIRTFGNYPDGVAFAVLFANMAAPSIDYFAKTRVYGK